MSDNLKLENQICFKYYVISKEIIRKYKPILDPLGLTYTGYITMLVLWEEEGLSVKELSDRLFLDSGTLTPLLKSLERKGFITRKRTEEDERVVKIYLTNKGQLLKKDAEEVPFKLVNNIFKDQQVDEKDMKDHIDTLNELMGTLVSN